MGRKPSRLAAEGFNGSVTQVFFFLNTILNFLIYFIKLMLVCVLDALIWQRKLKIENNKKNIF